MTTPDTSGEFYGRFEECSLTSGHNTTVCVYQCQCQMAAQCTNIHFYVLGGNFTLCGEDVVGSM